MSQALTDFCFQLSSKITRVEKVLAEFQAEMQSQKEIYDELIAWLEQNKNVNSNKECFQRTEKQQNLQPRFF
jgi:hypothetical protein